MKKYKINNQFIYDESLREIQSLHSNEIIRITILRARYLSFLIDNAQKNTVTRQTMMGAIWGVRGQYISDANLTQLFYLLRRDLRKIGLEDFFTTLPREGVIINNNIFIDTISTSPKKENKLMNNHAKNLHIMFLLLAITICVLFLKYPL